MYHDLINKLHAEAKYTDLEVVEAEYKSELMYLSANRRYQELLDLSCEVGFLLKQKSYGIKCSLPTGYSIFLLNQNEGFSYQRHETYKIELFHFFRPDHTSFCYLAPYHKFLETNAKQALDNFHINKQGLHEKHCVKPQTGDVILVKNIGDVHTVIGGVFEEFANTSLDHVTRLFDQNKNNIVEVQEREAVLNRLSKETYNFPSRMLDVSEEGEFEYNNFESKNYKNYTEYDLFNTHSLVAKHLEVLVFASLHTENKWYSLLNAGNGVLEVSAHNAIIYLNKLQSVIIPPDTKLELKARNGHAITCGVPKLIL